MTSFGLSLIAVIATLFAVDLCFRRARRNHEGHSNHCIADGYARFIIFYSFYTPVVERGVAMNLFLMGSLHIMAIAMAGLIWGIFGQGLMRRFLVAPLILLLFALRLCASLPCLCL